jgi:hypothetical protein
MRAELATKSDLDSVRSEVVGLRSEVADVKSDMLTLRAGCRLGLPVDAQGARRADRRTAPRGDEYHTSVIGHGVLISELEARVRRVEQHLNLPSLSPT